MIRPSDTSSLLWFRLVHAFTCAGILPRQYTKFSKFAELSVVGKLFSKRGEWLLVICIDDKQYTCTCTSVYKDRGYYSIMRDLALESMKRVVEEVMASSGSGSDSGSEVCLK